MDRRTRIGCSVAVAFCLAATGLFGSWMSQMLREVNEPNPASVSTDLVARKMGVAGIETSVVKNLYINRDVNAYIFEANRISGKVISIPAPSPTEWRIEGDEFERAFPNLYGEMVTRKRGSRTIVGFLGATTRGELRQFKDYFRKIWLDLSRD